MPHPNAWSLASPQWSGWVSIVQKIRIGNCWFCKTLWVQILANIRPLKNSNHFDTFDQNYWEINCLELCQNWVETPYLTILFMPIPSASSKIFWSWSKFFDCLQYFLNMFKYFWPCSNMQIYKVQFYFWQSSKIFDCVQKILNMVKIFWTWLNYFWTSRWNRH